MIIIYHLLLTLLMFATVYPMTFWISDKNPPVFPFHKYHLRMTNFSSGIAVLVLLFMPVSFYAKCLLVIWKIFLITASVYYWKKPRVNPWAMTVPFVLGVIAAAQIMEEVFYANLNDCASAVLSGLVLSGVFFLVHLCVWNIVFKEKSSTLLKKAVVVYSAILLFRFAWDCNVLFLMKPVTPCAPMETFDCLLMQKGAALSAKGVLLNMVFPFVALTFFRNKFENNTYAWALGFMAPVLVITIIGEICLRIAWYSYGIYL